MPKTIAIQILSDMKEVVENHEGETSTDDEIEHSIIGIGAKIEKLKQEMINEERSREALEEESEQEEAEKKEREKVGL